MANTPRPKPQIDKFRELARDLECDESEEAFKAKVQKIARASPRRREKASGGST